MINLNLVMILVCLGCLLSFVGKTNAKCIEAIPDKITVEVQSTTLTHDYVKREVNDLKDCTITIKDDNGTNLEVTFHDVSWIECAKIKVVKWFKDTF